MTKFIVAILFLSFSLIGFSQVNDAALYADISIEKRFNQALAVEYSNSNRFNENISELGSFVNEISLKYKINKKSKVSVSYRYSLKKELNNMYEPRSRFSMDFTQEFELGVFDVDLRFKGQIQQKSSLFDNHDSENNSSFRPKIKLKYKVNRFEPYLYFESFHPMLQVEYQPLSKIRGGAGVEYSLNKSHSFDCGYMIQKECFEKNPITDFVFKLGYKFKF